MYPKIIAEALAAEEKNSGSVEIDESNLVKIDDLDFQFLAVADKIIISIDDYRSGFECEKCKGTAKVEIVCSCVTADRPGYKNRFNEPCEECGGDYGSKTRSVECPSCQGKGALIVIPQTAKVLPSTGTITSVGETCKLLSSRVGNRIVFSPHTGTMLPLKGNVRLKIMREHEILCQVFGEGHTSKFIDYDVKFSEM